MVFRATPAQIVIASVIIIVAWLLLLRSNIPEKIKTFVTSLVIASPIPPIP